MQKGQAAPNFGPMIISLLGGLAFLLFDMEQMTDALNFIAGDGIRKLLGKLTTNRFTGVLPGALVTAIIIQSSPCRSSGLHGYSVRVLHRHEHVNHPFAMNMITVGVERIG